MEQRILTLLGKDTMKKIFIFILLLTTVAFNQDNSNVIEGLITSEETGEYPSSDSITVLCNDQPVSVNSDGEFLIKNLEFGTYIIVVKSKSFELFTQSIDITQERPTAFISCVLQKKKNTVQEEIITKQEYVETGIPWTIVGSVIDSRLNSVLRDKNMVITFNNDPVLIDKSGSFKIITRYRGTHVITVSLPRYHTVKKTITLGDNKKNHFITIETTLEQFKNNTRREVTVTGKRQALHTTASVSKTEIDHNDITRTAATMGDPIRVVHTLPGVASESDASARPIVRGGDFLENRIFFDGINLLQPYHFGGAFSTFNEAFVDKITFYRSGFPAKYHNAQSAIIDVESRNPAVDSQTVELDLNLFKYNSYVSIPIKKSNWGFNLGARGSYFDKTTRGFMKIFLPKDLYMDEFLETFHFPDYQSYNLGLQFKPTDKFSLKITEQFSKDRFHSVEPDSLQKVTYHIPGEEDVVIHYSRWDFIDYEFEMERLGATSYTIGEKKWGADTLFFYHSNYNTLLGKADMVLNDENFLTVSAAWQKQWFNILFPESFDDLYKNRYDVTTNLFSLNSHWLNSRIKNHLITAGLQLDYTDVSYNVSILRVMHEIITKGSTNFGDYFGPLTNDTSTTLSDFNEGDIVNRLFVFYKGDKQYLNSGLYFEDDITFSDRLSMIAGLRLEHSTSENKLTISPRFSLKYSKDDKFEFINSIGHYNQNNYDAAALALSENLRPEKVWHLGSSVEHRILPWLNHKIDLYGKYYYDLTSERINTNDLLDDEDFFKKFEQYLIDKNINIANLTEQEIQTLYQTFLYEQGEFHSFYSNNGKGIAAGLEYFLRFDPTDYWHGWIAVSYGQSFRQRHEGWRWHHFPFERPLIISLVNYYRLPRKYELAIKYKFMSGIPYTNIQFNDDKTVIGNYNEHRYTPYRRLDLRIAKGFSVKRKFKGAIYLELWNVMNIPNMFLLDNDTKRLKMMGLNLPVTAVLFGLDFKF